jgi:hypothetical protein
MRIGIVLRVADLNRWANDMKIYVIGVLLFLAGCAHQKGESGMSVEEAVLRFQFEHNGSVHQNRAAVYFLALGNPEDGTAKDPAEDFLARFVGVRPRVAKFSEAVRRDRGWILDNKTKGVGIIFFVHSVRIIGRDIAEAKGGYQEAELSSSGTTFRLRLGSRGWRVVDAKMDWIAEMRPNQASEPTPTSVSCRAGARPAPAADVAHL